MGEEEEDESERWVLGLLFIPKKKKNFPLPIPPRGDPNLDPLINLVPPSFTAHAIKPRFEAGHDELPYLVRLESPRLKFSEALEPVLLFFHPVTGLINPPWTGEGKGRNILNSIFYFSIFIYFIYFKFYILYFFLLVFDPDSIAAFASGGRKGGTGLKVKKKIRFPLFVKIS